MQPDNRLLTNLIKSEKEHHSALLALLVRSHTSLAALSAYASTAAPPVAQALLGCIQAFSTADEGLRGYAAALEGWKEELKEVKRVEDEYKTVVRDKEILVGRLIKASKTKIPTSSLQAGPAPIPAITYPPASPSSSSFSLPTSQPYQFTPTPHATQHINSKLALAQRELQACEAHLASKEAELAEVRRSAIAEGMARRCRAMADVGHVWRERGEQGLRTLDELGHDAGAAPPVQPYYHPPRRSMSSHSGSSITPSHSASQQRRSQSPFYVPPRAQSPGTYQTLSGGYQHSHPLPALPERESWHGEPSYDPPDPRRPMSLIDPPRAPRMVDPRRPVSSHDLPALPDEEPVTLDIPPPHSIQDGELIPVGRTSSVGHEGWPMREPEWSSSEDEGEYRVVENERTWEPPVEVDEEIMRAVERMGVVAPKPPSKAPPTPPTTASPSTNLVSLPDVKVVEATPPRRRTKKKTKEVVPGERIFGGERLMPTPTTSAPAPAPALRVLSPEPRVPLEPVAHAASPLPVAHSPLPPRAASPEPAFVPVTLDGPKPTPTSPPAPQPGALPVSAAAINPNSDQPHSAPDDDDTDTDYESIHVAQDDVSDHHEDDGDQDLTTTATELVSSLPLASPAVAQSASPPPVLAPVPVPPLAAPPSPVPPSPTVLAARVPTPPLASATVDPAPSTVPAPDSMPLTKKRIVSSSSEPVKTHTRVVSSSSEPLGRTKSKASQAKKVTSDAETAERGKKKLKGHSRSNTVDTGRPKSRLAPNRQPTAEDRADLAALLRDSDAPSPHVHFPAPGGMFVASAPAPRPVGTMYVPVSGTTRSDVGPARGSHFDVPPSPVSAGRPRSGSGSAVGFFGRVAGLFGRKRGAGDGYLSSGGGGGSGTWRTRTDGNIVRVGGDDSSDEDHGNLVAITNPPRTAADTTARTTTTTTTTDHAKPAPGRKLTKADRGQTLRMGPPESPTEPAKPKKKKTRSEDGVGRKNHASRKEPASLMAIVEGPGLDLASDLKTKDLSPPVGGGQTLEVPTVVSPTTTAAPKPVRATSPTPLKSALRNRTPSPLPPTPSPQVLAPPVSSAPIPSPRNSIAESVYETGEEDFDESDATPTRASPPPVAPSAGTALAAFKDGLTQASNPGSVSTAGPRSRKSVRINPAPPEMSATPAATPGSELEEEPSWKAPTSSAQPANGGWTSRIGRGWEDSSDESDEEYERVRRALESSSKHMDAVNGVRRK